MKSAVSVLLLLSLLVSVCQGADCEKALFGWTLKSGERVDGTLDNEGVTGRNPRGYQNLKSDSGNFRHGRNCGGTAYGIACGPNPGVNVRTLTKDGAVKFYHDNQWQRINGDEIASQYIAYKAFDLVVNTGNPKIFDDTIAQLSNGKFRPDGKITKEEIAWLNDYTKTEWVDGRPDRTKRQLFISTMVINAMRKYISIARHSPKKRQFLLTWSSRDIEDE